MKNQTHNLTTETRRTFAADRLEMVERFRRSGKSHREFCQSERILKSTLDWWLRQIKGRSKKKRVAFPELAHASDVCRTFFEGEPDRESGTTVSFVQLD